MTLHLAFLGITSLREFGQSLVDGVITGSRYALVGVALALILGVTGRFHFAFAISFTLGAYVAAVLVGSAGWAWPLAVVAGMAAAAVHGVACEALVYRPLERRTAGSVTLGVFVASLGLTIIGQNAISLIWTSNGRSLSAIPAQGLHVAGLNATTLDVAIIGLAVAVAVGLGTVLRRTSLGRQIKAVRVNSELALIVGINQRRVFLAVFAMASAVGGLGGMLDGMKFAVVPTMGTQPLLYGMVVAFLVGTRADPMMVLVGGLGVGVIQNLSTLWVSEEASVVAVFGLLIVFLTYRSVRIALLRYSESPLHAIRRAVTKRRRPTSAGVDR